MQRVPTAERLIPALLLADGAAAVFFAVFAHAIGMDPNPDWGRSRVALFLLGILAIGVSFYLFRRSPAFMQTETGATAALVGHVWAVTLLLYVWFVTFGSFTEWRASTRYYSLLADAFGRAQLHVDVKPGARLLAAADPYNSEGRPPFDDEVWDLSLYKGKLYLYWGPVPALLLVPVQLALKTSLPDMYPVFFFFSGLLVVNTLLLLKIRKLSFANLPRRYLAAALFVTGLILPIPWSLSLPDVYEAAIGAGQFFLVGGVYFVVLAFESLLPPGTTGKPPERFLLLAGLFWACSVGSRAINVFSILFLAAFSIYWIWKTRLKDRMRLSASLLAPLAFGAILIGWYNYARFDSPLEFGLRYQITVQNLNRDMPLAFEFDYLPYNLLGYVFMPFKPVPAFPFIEPVGLTALLQSRGMTAPGLFAAGNVTGILFFAPFLLLAVVPFLRKPAATFPPSLQSLILQLLGGSFAIAFGGLLVYYYGQMRFLVDLVSQAALLASAGYWTIAQSPSKTRLRLANLLVLFTLAASLLLAVTGESGRMEKLNPALMDKMDSLFRWED